MVASRFVVAISMLLLLQASNAIEVCPAGQLMGPTSSTNSIKYNQRLEIEVKTIRKQISGTATEKQLNPSVARSIELKNDGKTVIVEPRIQLAFLGNEICISVREIVLENEIATGSNCHKKCATIRNHMQIHIGLQKETFSSEQNSTIETIVAFTVTKKRTKCNFCLGDECLEGKSYVKQCPADEPCFYLTLRDHEHDEDAFTNMGCVSDILFQRLRPAECWNGCRHNIRYGISNRYVCTYCCNTSLCNNATKMRQTEDRARYKVSSAHMKHATIHPIWNGICLTFILCLIIEVYFQ